MKLYGNIFAEGHHNNSMFAPEDCTHRYNPTYTFRVLRQAFLDAGIEINTPDLNQGRQIAFDLYVEGREFAPDDIPKYLIALENPNINRLNENREYCRRFAKVFAWDARLSDLPNIRKILVPNHLVSESTPSFAERDIFSCIINANKAFRELLPTDLYLERINTIRWYENNEPEHFALYGMGWAKPSPAFGVWPKVKRRIARLQSQLFGRKPFPSYRGEVLNKKEVLRRCKFSYCYENTRDLSNYITEKIFDSFLAGCVPIYWGADNVTEYIPPDCFIDRRNFTDTAAVHTFLTSVAPEQHAQYQSNIADFLQGDVAKMFSSEYFAATVVEQITCDLLKKK